MISTALHFRKFKQISSQFGFQNFVPHTLKSRLKGEKSTLHNPTALNLLTASLKIRSTPNQFTLIVIYLQMNI